MLIDSLRRNLAIVSMLAAVSVAFRRGSLTVTAFSAATYSSTTRGARASLRSPSFLPRQGRVGSLSGTALRQASVVASKTDLEKALEVEHPAYEVIQRDIVNEYGAYCTLFRHKKSGAEILSVSNDDDNKVFGITLRTPPEDSTGVPHILEHSVLCGSKKYKTKDPFVQLLQGSLQTFLNAFTYPDRTCYVVASQNEKDFRNLMSVYFDAVYNPRCITDPNVLAQEGHHLELDSKEGPLTYKGVVYNEMKGVYSSADSRLSRSSMRSIFPDNAYAVDSGGDPSKIPDLTFDQFVEFHRKFYSPSNSRIYFSGDDDVYARLELADEYLREFDVVPDAREKSTIHWQPKKFTEPVKEVQYYPSSGDQPDKHMLTVNWLLNDKPMSTFEELTLEVLDHLMTGTTSSILRKTLMESGLGEAITGGGLSDELLQATFSIGLKGVEPSKTEQVEKLVLDTMKKIADDGFEEDDIASSLNTIEFQMREFNTGSFPKGLSLMLGSMSKWVYDRNPTEALKFEGPLQMLKDKIAESGSKVFQDMVRELLVENTHRTTVELKPSKTLEEEDLKEEQSRLDAIKSKLSKDELDEVMAKAKELQELQAAEDAPDDRATIPRLTLDDIKREAAEYPIEVTKNAQDSGVTLVRHEVGSTSGIAYVNLAVDLSPLSLEDAKLIPIFTKLMMENGAGEYDAVALSRRIGTYTGGIDVNVLSTAVHGEGTDASVVKSGENLVTKLMIRGKATSDNANELFRLFKLILTEANFDSKTKVIELLKESRSRLESRIQSSGHSMVNNRMSARYRVGGFITEIMGGISYLDTLKELIKQAEEDWPTLLARLEKMRKVILDESLCRDGMIVDITGDENVFSAIEPEVSKFLSSLPGKANAGKLPNFYKEVHPWVSQAKKLMAEMTPLEDEGFVVPTQVSYVGKAGMLYEEGEHVPGSTKVISRFLGTGYMWDRVRVMGGAYGGMCQFSTYSSLFCFLSYRDPNLEKTIDVYDGAADALAEAAEYLAKDPAALETAIIGAIGDIDGALSPDQKGYTSFQRWLINEGPGYRQKMRDEILNTKASDFADFAKRLKNMKDPSVAVVSSKGAFEKAAKAGKVMKLKEIY